MTINRPNRGANALLYFFSSLFLLACSPVPQDESATQNQVDDSRQKIDLIIQGDYVVSMDADGSVYKDAAVAVDQGAIIAVGGAAEIVATYNAADTLPGENRIVMPGLINGHSHAAMTLLRGVADDLALMDWLTNYIFPAEVEFAIFSRTLLILWLEFEFFRNSVGRRFILLKFAIIRTGNENKST